MVILICVMQGVPDLSEFGDVYQLGFGLGQDKPPTSALVKKEFQRKIIYHLSPHEVCIQKGGKGSCMLCFMYTTVYLTHVHLLRHTLWLQGTPHAMYLYLPSISLSYAFATCRTFYGNFFKRRPKHTRFIQIKTS